MNWSAGRSWVSLALNEEQASGFLSGRSLSAGSDQPGNSRGRSDERDGRGGPRRSVAVAIILESFLIWM